MNGMLTAPWMWPEPSPGQGQRTKGRTGLKSHAVGEGGLEAAIRYSYKDREFQK